MTIDDFRRIALAMPGTEERNGLGYPNFRARGKSFATIESAVALIRLTRDQQATFMATAPDIFAPALMAGGNGAVQLFDLKQPTKQRYETHSPRLGAISPVSLSILQGC